MSNNSFSSEALSIINEFYNTEVVVYVEGEDDILFWYNFFKISQINAQVEQVGGKNNLIEYIEKITLLNAKIIVATDSDYTKILGVNHDHPLIIYTYGYSIENTLYCSKSISGAVASFMKQPFVSDHIIDEWQNDLIQKTDELIVFDIVNTKYNKSIRVMGNACNQFLKSDTSPYLDEVKIDNHLKILEEKISNEEIGKVKNLLENCLLPKYMIIKGHFITSALINLIKKIIKKEKKKSLTFSCESLYSIMINNCRNVECTCEQKEYYYDKIYKAIEYLN